MIADKNQIIQTAHKYLLQGRNHSSGMLLKHYAVYRILMECMLSILDKALHTTCLVLERPDRHSPASLHMGTLGLVLFRCSVSVWD